MSTTTFHGSCHCGRVRFEADLDLARGTSKCNCTYCWKIRNWSAFTAPAGFRLLAGAGEVSEYSKGPQAHHVFCRHCGAQPYAWGHIPEIGGDYVSISLSCVDDLNPAELLAAPIRYLDGRHDAWMTTPAETRHL